MIQNNTIEITGDGSCTLFVPDLNEHYHSVNGARQESLHVYIEAGLNACPLSSVSVLEIGFGTGLNALLTWEESKKRSLHINYTTIEKYPLTEELIVRLNYEVHPFHAAAWEAWERIDACFSIYKMNADLLTCSFPGLYDVVYYDAFAPDKQPDVWSQEIFDRIFEVINPRGILTTYCAKGEVRRMLQRTGFTVERIPGPPGKREMLRARKA